MSTGQIVLANHQRGMYAVQIQSGDITVFELLGSIPPDLGDIISGNLDDSCSDSFYNQTQEEEIDIIVQALGCTPLSARSLLS